MYGEDTAYFDHSMQRLLARLKSMGLYDDSVIAFTADHGEEFQEHGGWWHGTTLYEEQVHVPLLIKRAREARAGQVEPSIVRSLDIAPTLMAAAGLRAPAAFQGVDLFASARTADGPLLAEEDFEGNVLASLRVGVWKVISANPDNPRGLKPVELYNLLDDGGERRDMAAAEPQRAAEMLQRLAQERARVANGTP